MPGYYLLKPLIIIEAGPNVGVWMSPPPNADLTWSPTITPVTTEALEELAQEMIDSGTYNSVTVLTADPITEGNDNDGIVRRWTDDHPAVQDHVYNPALNGEPGREMQIRSKDVVEWEETANPVCPNCDEGLKCNCDKEV